MIDILLKSDGDLYISPNGNIQLGESVSQKIKIKLKWFEGEWRWDTDEGLPYLSDLLIKNPDTDYFESVIREKIFEVVEVTDVRDVSVTFNTESRAAVIRFVACTEQETIKEEVKLQWQQWQITE